MSENNSNAAPAIPQRATLKLENAKHSKSYFAELVETEGGWVVNFSYGAIGSTQKTGTKTKAPLTYQKALSIYEKLIHEKTGVPCDCCGACYTGAYTSATAATKTETKPKIAVSTVEHTPFRAALLSPIDAEQAQAYFHNVNFVVQRKYDGKRMAISNRGGETVAFNRKGERIPVPVELKCLITLMDATGFYLDGEFVNGEYVAFDLLECGGVDIRPLPMFRRFLLLQELLAGSGIKVAISVAHSLTEKLDLLEQEHKNRGEGLVFKHANQPYMPGRQGTDVKFKFWESATVRVCKKQKNHDSHSFGVEVLIKGVPGIRKDVWAFAGNVTCKGPLPEIGTYREVKYLYVGNGGHLYQPEDLGARTDVDDDDCTHTQLKLKGDA